jgi:hypothetical protein
MLQRLLLYAQKSGKETRNRYGLPSDEYSKMCLGHIRRRILPKITHGGH